MRQIRLFFLSIIILGLSACNKETVDNTESVFYEYIPRTAEKVWVDNVLAEKESIKHKDEKEEFIHTKYSEIETGTSVSLSNYRFYLSTCNFGYDVLKNPNADNLENHSFLMPLFRILGDQYKGKADKMIEGQLKTVFEKNQNISSRSNALETRSCLSFIEYRTTPIKDISIYFSSDILGVKKGDSITKLLDVDFYGVKHKFIIKKDKKVFRPESKVMPLIKYFSYTPMAPVELYIMFKDNYKLNEKVTGKFTVVMETTEGKQIEASTREITLTP